MAEDYATLIPDLTAEMSLDVAMIDDFAGRCDGQRSGRLPAQHHRHQDDVAVPDPLGPADHVLDRH